MNTSLALLLSILLGVILSVGSCTGVNTSQIEDLADQYGIEAIDPADAYDEYAAQIESEAAEFAEYVEDTTEAIGSEIGMANPWTETADSYDAAEGAGLDYFMETEFELPMGTPFAITYSYMDGMAQVVYDYAASDVTVRKAIYTNEGDISGDYRVFTLEWTQDIDGVEVTCEGNRAGAASKVTWCDGEHAYSIVTRGLGGDTDFGLDAEGVATIVTALAVPEAE